MLARELITYFSSHWTMDFDTSPRMLSSLQSELTKDPRVIRWTTLKLGDRIQQITKSPEKTITRDMGPASLKQLGPGNQGIGGGLFERNQFTQSSNSWAPWQSRRDIGSMALDWVIDGHDRAQRVNYLSYRHLLNPRLVPFPRLRRLHHVFGATAHAYPFFELLGNHWSSR